MRAILKKTIGPNFKAGDVIKGEYSRIDRLNKKGLTTPDQSIIAMIGNSISFITSALIIFINILLFVPQMQIIIPISIPFIWKLTFIALATGTLFINMAYFIGASMPYLAYYLGFSTNIISGVMVLFGHEKAVSRYQPSTISASAAITLITTSTIGIVIAVLTIINRNTEIFMYKSDVKNLLSWLIFVLITASGIVIAVSYDVSFKRRKERYISFLKRKNATIEYKTKAISSYRKYLNNGNAEKFLEENIEIMEATLSVDREQIVGKNGKKK